MKKGFTLLELIVVIIIIGVLATLGFGQYTRMIERARGAEARQVAGSLRTQAAALWLERHDAAGVVPASTITNAAVGIGGQAGQIPNTCGAASSPGYFFRYGVAQNAANTGMVVTATRCIGGTSKTPVGPAATTLTLTSDFNAGTDTWGGTGGY